jgi:ABC-type antimicrobial peptide transport system permease subunit
MQPSSWSGTGVVVRFEGDAQAVAKAIRTGLQGMSGEQVMYSVETMQEVIAETLGERRVSMIVLAAFAALALGLASMGIYGVISYLVGQRTHEIGIRVALGAKQSDVLGMVLREGIRMTVIGVAIGLIAAAGLTRLMANLLFGVSATDPLTFAGVAVVLTFVALVACYLPARRAMKVDPILALRHE